MTLKFKIILSGFFCLFFGVLLFYFQGYKNSSFIQYVSVGFIYLGWIIFISSLFWKVLITDKKIPFASHKFLWIKNKTIKLMIYSIFGIGLVGTMEFTSTVGSERAAKILEVEPTENTIAIVTKIDSRNSRGGSKLWAILSYQTKTANITQAVYDYTGKYSVGQKYLVRYSIDNPEMFQIIEKKE